MGVGYQSTDRNVIDYDLWFEPESMFEFRGPRRDFSSSGGIVCIGAAQTFGRFVARPYPQQLSDLLEHEVLNLGRSGAGPEFYLNRPSLVARIHRADTVIVQAMSARSVSAGRFQALSNNNGVLSFVDGPYAGERYLAQKAYKILRDTEGEDAFRTQIGAVQAQWLAHHRQLAEAISGDKILLWLSSAEPSNELVLKDSAVGTFPHFVTAEMVENVLEMGFKPVICTLENMAPQVLVNDRTKIVEPVFAKADFPNRPGKLRALNSYYATPELHDKAARELMRVLLS